jgi:hypothetical protein
MKIAMTISGQPRRVDAGFKQLKKHFLDKYDIDIYIHSWKDKYFYKYYYGQLQHKWEVDQSIYDKVLELYQPKDYLFERGIRFDKSNMVDTGRFDSHMGMTLSWKRAWDLVENSGIKYDLIIRTRFDLLFDHYVPVNHPYLTDITKLDPNKLHLFRRVYDPTARISILDLFGIGGYDVMDKYHKFFPNLIHYYFENEDYKDLMVNKENVSHFYVESSLHYHLKNLGIEFSTEFEPDIREVFRGPEPHPYIDRIRILR